MKKKQNKYIMKREPKKPGRRDYILPLNLSSVGRGLLQILKAILQAIIVGVIMLLLRSHYGL
jgi:hypothetical protein